MELFIAGFLQMSIVSWNVKNMAEGKVWATMITTLILSLTWGYVFLYIARDLQNTVNIYLYALGASCGAGFGIFSRSRVSQWWKNRSKDGKEAGDV